MGFMALKKCCNGCEIGQACSHAYTIEPPCAVEYLNSIQQLKAEIAAIVSKSKRCCKLGKEWHEVYIDFKEMERLRKISVF